MNIKSQRHKLLFPICKFSDTISNFCDLSSFQLTTYSLLQQSYTQVQKSHSSISQCLQRPYL